MPLGCIVETTDDTPDQLVDTTALSVSLNNQGVATLSLTVLRKDRTPISSSSFVFTLNDQVFQGFIDSDNIAKLDGTDFLEHNIVSLGEIS